MLIRSAILMGGALAFLAGTPHTADRQGDAGALVRVQAPAEAPAPIAEDEPSVSGAPNEPAAVPVDPPVAAPEPQPPAAAPSPSAPSSPPPAAALPSGEKAAKDLFGAKKVPTRGGAAAIGYYPRGCLAGGVELADTGPTWQVMRLSRNRNWGHPTLVRFVKNFSARAAKATGWPGILVGDLAQPRGGPTPSSHMSHQTGLDVDIWFVPMPKRTLTPQEREEMSANNLVSSDWKHINPEVYTAQHAAFIKAATQSPEVERVLVNAAIKKKLCESAGSDRDWLKKVRPWYGHHDHIHVRLRCPEGSPECKGQPPTPAEEGCKAEDFKFWFTKAIEPKKPSTKPAKPIRLADLPAACKAVLNAP